MDSDITPGTPGGQDRSGDSPDKLNELLAELIPIAKVAGEVLTLAVAAASTPEGQKVLGNLTDRFGLLIAALATGGFMPGGKDAFSIPWLQFFLARSDDAVRKQADAHELPHYNPSGQRMHTGEDFVRLSVDKKKEAQP